MQSNGHSSPRRRGAHFKYNHGVEMTDVLEEEPQTSDEKSFGLGSMKSIIALEMFSAFIWWSVFQGSVPLLCHPESNMLSKISFSYFFLGLVWSSPLLLIVGMVRNAVSTSSGLLALRLIILAGAASFQLHEPSGHAIGMGLSLVAAILILYVKLWPISKMDRHRNIYYHFLGLILTLALRIWFSSINPLFLSATLNTLIVIAGAVTAIALYILDWRTPIIRKKEYSRFVQIFSDSYEEVDEDSWSGAVWAGAGFGFLLFVLQCVFANTTIILSWANLPSSKGTAVSFPLDPLVTLPLSLGVLLSRDQYRHLLTAGQWLFLGITGFLLPSIASSSAALLGQAFLAIYVSSLWTQLCQRMSQFLAYRTLTVALLVYFTTLLLSSALYHLHHWIMYAFIITAIVLVWYSFRLYVNSLEDGQSEAQQFERMAMRRVSYVSMFGRTIRRLSTLIEEDEEVEGTEEEDEDIDEFKIMQDFTAQKDMVRQLLMCESIEMKLFDRKVVMTILFLGVFAAFGSVFWQLNLQHTASQHMSDNMSLMVWDLTGSRDYNMHQNQSLNVLCLTGSSNPYADTGDPAKWISVTNRMEVARGPCLHLHCNKITLLSQVPLLRSEKLVLYTDKGGVAAVGVKASLTSLKHNSLTVFCMDMKADSYSELLKEVEQSTSDPAVLLVHSSSSVLSPISDFKSAGLDAVNKCSKSTGIYFQGFDQVSSTVCSSSYGTSSSSISARLKLQVPTNQHAPTST